MDRDQLFQVQPVDNPLLPNETVQQEASPLTLELNDTEVSNTLDDWLDDSRKFFKEKYNLYERRKRNEVMLFGRQLDEKDKRKEIKQYEARYLDNVLYEIEASLKPLAMSRLPDMIVTPGNDTDESRKVAEDISKVLDTDIKKREIRQVLGIGFKHHPVYFTAVIKVRWDPEKNDIVFENVHPEYIDVDNTSNSKDADDMKWIAQTLPISVQECAMRFPDKKDELFEELRKDGIDVGTSEEPKTKALLSEIKIREIWFDWYEKKGDDKWEKVSAVMWKYKKVVLKKMKNPNFDYEGEQQYFSYTNDGAKVKVTDEMMMQMALTGQAPAGITSEQIYRNYFDRPRKPFFFFGYDQWKKIPYDETSRIEQNITNQANLDKTGKNIFDKLSARVKHVFSKDGGLKKADIEQMDMANPNQDILVEGDVNKVHSAIIPEQPTQQEFSELQNTRTRMYGVAGSNAIRGEVMSDTATSNQIAREADFTRADDLVEDTISEACEWMSQWKMHLIKLRYTEEHFKKLSGARGNTVFIKLHRDMIEDGMEVVIKSSGTDKLKTEKKANEMAQLKMIDPLNYFRDIGLQDPEGRTKDLMMFTTDPASYMAKVMGLGETTQQLVTTLNGEGTTSQPPNQGVVPAPAVSTGIPVAEGQLPSPVETAAVPTAPSTGAPQGSPRNL